MVKNTNGFTIVELLIVIVVIAIISAISVMAYSGIKEKSERAAIITHVKQYATAIEMYIVENGKAPRADWRCLGDSTTLPAENGYDENYCFKPSNGGTYSGDSAPADPQLMQQLAKYMDRMPTARFPETQAMYGRIYRGMLYDGSLTTRPSYPATISYFTKFPQCPIGERIDWWTIDNPNYSGCIYILSVNELGTPYANN